MSDIYDTHEQGERVKSWLRENGSAIVMGLVLAFGLMFGFKQWQVWQTSKRQQASAEYQVMASLVKDNNMDAAVSNYQALKTDFPKSAYASMAALMMAKARMLAGQAELAASDLEFAMEHGQPEPLRVIARERLARVKLSQGDTDAALKLLEGAPSNVGFEALFAEIRGDVYVAKGETAQAIESYQVALDALQEGVGNRDLLNIKMQALSASADNAATLDDGAGGGEM
jgi:predicted negative regulator of RcsB-dependent stress response